MFRQFLGVPELIVFVFILVPLALVAGAAYWVVNTLGRRAERLGYASRSEYVQAPPRSDPEKRDAVDLALKGAVLCILGALFPPFVLVGLVPLFYGGRKIIYASMGLGLVDDGELPRT